MYIFNLSKNSAIHSKVLLEILINKNIHNYMHLSMYTLVLGTEPLTVSISLICPLAVRFQPHPQNNVLNNDK